MSGEHPGGGNIGSIILSGGSSHRMGKPKALLKINAKTFVEKIISDYRELGCDPIIIVTGEHTEIIGKATSTYGVQNIINDHPENGPFSSLKIGISVLSRDCAGFFIAPVDHPAVEVRTLQLMLKLWNGDSAVIVKPTYNGSGGHPVLMGSEMLRFIEQWPESSNLRELIRERAECVIKLPVSDAGVLMNIDTDDDYQKLLEYK